MKFSGKNTVWCLSLLVSLMLPSPVLFAIPGEHEVGVRSRYQQTQDEWFDNATTWTTRVFARSLFTLDQQEQWQFQFQPNFVGTHVDKFNSVTDYNSHSIIPDTKGFSLTQAYMGYSGFTDWQIKLGRQSLSHDNERFLGQLEYWQTPQSFDAISLTYRDAIHWHVQYAYSNKVHRIYGPDAKPRLPKSDSRYVHSPYRPASELGQQSLGAHLLHLKYRVDPTLNIQGYFYALNNQDQATSSSQTVGLVLSQRLKPKRFKYSYRLEYATQVDSFDNPYDYQAWYGLIEGEVQYKSHVLRVSQEVLSEDKGIGFQTHLGTNHKFLGWADVFSGYFGDHGVRDTFVTYKGRRGRLRWRAVLHDFKAYSDGQYLGRELDLELVYRFDRKWQAQLVYADFNTSRQWHSRHIAANFDLSTWFLSVSYNL